MVNARKSGMSSITTLGHLSLPVNPYSSLTYDRPSRRPEQLKGRCDGDAMYGGEP